MHSFLSTQALSEQKEQLEAELDGARTQAAGEGNSEGKDTDEAKEAVKTIMADVFLALHEGFEDETSYTGKQVMKIIRKVMKKATQGHEEHEEDDGEGGGAAEGGAEG